MKKLKILCLLLLVLLTTSCGQKEEVINIPTAATSGNLYPLGAALANLYNDKIPGIKACNQASNGGLDNLHLMERKEVQLTFGVSNIVYDAYMGQGLFQGHANKDLRVIAGLYYNPNQIVVRADRGIESLEDLKGHSFAPGSHGSTTETECRNHLGLLGLDSGRDLKAQYLGFSEAGEEIRNGSLDGTWIMAGTPTAAVTELMTTSPVKILSLDPDYLARIQKDYPWYADYTIPKGTYPKQDQDVHTTAIKMLMYTDKDLDDQVVYQMCRVFWENIQDLQKTIPSLKEVRVDQALENISNLPVHPGAMKYYQEISQKAIDSEE
ncbi:TRAP transporter solute receptor, TAXI family [Peptoniphilus sp. oral taxon 375 str. F0436]|nr:TRAP transporter solute receptor, TAXI family [Peptoniphilus sp. oral taxon 375 str. F0436]